MYIIVGLGNPTMKYAKTRHNVGFDTIDMISKKYKIKIKKRGFKAQYGEGHIGNEKVVLVKPMTFMNNSGEAVKEIVDYYKIDPTKELIIIYDDLSLDVGTIRIRLKGSAGGHNGIKSIIKYLGTQEFPRVKVGIGAVPEGGDIINHVLGKFPREDRRDIKKVFEVLTDVIEFMICESMEKSMSKYNGKCI